MTKSSDKIWGNYNAKLIELMKENNWFGLSVVYYEMADMLRREGRNDKKEIEQGIRCKIMAMENAIHQYEELGVIKFIEIIAAGKQSCGKCRKMDGKKLTITEADNKLQNLIKKCTDSYGCKCSFAPVVR